MILIWLDKLLDYGYEKVFIYTYHVHNIYVDRQ